LSRARALADVTKRGAALEPPFAYPRHRLVDAFAPSARPVDSRLVVWFPRRQGEERYGVEEKTQRGRPRSAGCKKSRAPGPEDLGRLTAENPWSHDDPLRGGSNHMIFLMKSEMETAALAGVHRGGRRPGATT
jgi:hypothetical protein